MPRTPKPTELDDADFQELEDFMLDHEADSFNDTYDCNESELEFMRRLGVIQ